MEPVIPMEPKTSHVIPSGEDWITQVKWDGVRVLTYHDGNHTSLNNRKKRERTHHYPELTDLQSYCSARSVILDGEVIALGENGKPSFHEVMRRDGIRRVERVDRIKAAVPIHYMIFDGLYLNGEWVNQRPLSERTQLLAEIIKPRDEIQMVTSYPDGEALFDAIKDQGMEGIVVKRIDSPHVLGNKNDYWIKKKNYRDLIAVIGGFTLRGATVNSVLLGLYDQKGDFRYVGHSGTGKLSGSEWKQLTDVLSPMVTQEVPFVDLPPRHRDAHWVKPRLTVKIQFIEWTEGSHLRQPSIQGFTEMDPSNCVFKQEE